MLIQQTSCRGSSVPAMNTFGPVGTTFSAAKPDRFTLTGASRSQAFLASSKSVNPKLLEPMRALGLSVASGQKLVQQLQANHDKPYHAGRLMNGKTYIITQNDKLYYGLPNALKEVPVTHATRNRCIDQQTRDYTAENGLHIRIQTKDNQRNTNASFSLLGLPVPLPHLKQAPVAVWD